MSPPPPNLTMFATVVLVIVFLRPATAAIDYGTAADDDDMFGSPYDQNTLSSICQLAADPKTCESTLHSISPGLSTTTAVDIVKLHMEAAGRNTMAGQRDAAKLLKDPKKKAEPAMKSALEACAKEYAAAAGSISKVVQELGKSGGLDKHGVVTGMSSVTAASQKCENEIKAADKKEKSPMAKYSDENSKIVGNAVKLFSKYWSVKESDVAHSPADDPVDMDTVVAICDKAENATECVNSVRMGDRLLPYKGTTDAFAVLALSGRATGQSCKQAAKIIMQKEKDKGIASAAKSSLEACGRHYLEAGDYIDKVFNGEMSKGGAEKVDGAKLKKQLADITKRFKECQTAVDKGGHLDGRLLELQKRLQTQALNNEALAGIVWTN